MGGQRAIVGGWGEPIPDGGEGDASDGQGTERLAWYRSFHYGYAWGVFIRVYGIDVVATQLHATGMGWATAQVVAYEFLLRHELGHVQTDLAVSAGELLGQEALFIRGRREQKRRWPGYGVEEEGLCNALARESLPRGNRSSLDEWLNRAPVGYRDFRKHQASVRPLSWHSTIADAVGTAGFWSLTPELTEDLRAQVPVYLYVDDGYEVQGIEDGLVGPIVVKETRDFLKDFRSTGNPKVLARQWQKTKDDLAAGRLAGGTQVKRLDDTKYRVKISRAARVGLVRQDGEWFAVLLDQQHDRFYERFRRLRVPVTGA